MLQLKYPSFSKTTIPFPKYFVMRILNIHNLTSHHLDVFIRWIHITIRMVLKHYELNSKIRKTLFLSLVIILCIIPERERKREREKEKKGEGDRLQRGGRYENQDITNTWRQFCVFFFWEGGGGMPWMTEHQDLYKLMSKLPWTSLSLWKLPKLGMPFLYLLYRFNKCLQFKKKNHILTLESIK